MTSVKLALVTSLTWITIGCTAGDIDGGGGGGGGGDSDGGGAAHAADAVPPDAPRPDAEPSVLAGWCSNQGANFSFFVTSMSALWKLAGSDPNDLDGGFGGDFGGLAGADEICQTIATATGHGDKTWRAFLSATDDGGGNPVHAITRIGSGPWHDANGRTVATGIAGLADDRPDGDPASTADLPDECGVPITAIGDAHDVPTGSDKDGRLFDSDPSSTCNEWTSSDPNVGGDGTFQGGRVMCGHTFPRIPGASFGANWVSDHQLRGCGKGANLSQNGAGEGRCIGCTGGYGALYCFAL